LERELRALREFCARHHVRKLYLFGSVLTEEFDDESDVDVMIEPAASPSIHEHFVMQDELEALFGRKVDLVTRDAVERNPSPTRRERILSSAKLYASD
jgi:predicted nucleotidyltransferase